MLKVIRDPRDGITIVSEETGLQYNLLELKSYQGIATSDIVSVFVALPDFGYFGQLDYLFGASYEEDMIEGCKEMISEFENGERYMISSLDLDGDLAEYVKHNNLKIKLKEVII